jgi:hypothetical protein
VSIDPARKNYALRIERRYHNGWITPVVFNKVSIETIQEDGPVTISNTYQTLTSFLDTYQEFYDQCHFIVIERQLPQNYKATRIAQHTISYFSIHLKDKPLYPAIIEIDPKLKGKVLGAPRTLTAQQLKPWAVEVARNILDLRMDTYSLEVLNHFKKKQDDLSDTICQVEALFLCWGAPPSGPPGLIPEGTEVPLPFASSDIVPPIVLPGIGGVPLPPKPKKPRSSKAAVEPSKPKRVRAELIKFVQEAPARTAPVVSLSRLKIEPK